MIEKLDTTKFGFIEAKVLGDKVNELVEGYNALHEKLDPLQAKIDFETTEVTWQYRLERKDG